MTKITRNGLTTTDDRDEARHFATHEAAVEFTNTTPGVPISSRVMGFINLIGGMEHHIIHLPGIVDRYVAEFIDPSQFGETENSMEPLGPEYGYGQTFGQDVDIVSDLIKALQQCDPQAAVRIQGYTTKTLHSIRNVRDTATTTGDPLVMIRSY